MLATAHLRLDPLTRDDLDSFHALCASPGVRRFLFDDEVVPVEQTRAFVEESERLQATEGTGLWGARLRERNVLVGFCGFWYFRDPPELELLFAVDEPFWGGGLATEMATAMLRHGFDTIGFRRIVGSTDATNLASVRVMEKVGMRFVRRAIVGGLDTIFYEAVRPG